MHDLSEFFPEKKSQTFPLRAGALLIAEPFMQDPTFGRSVVLLCNHGNEGTFGLIFNEMGKPLLDDLLSEDLYPDVPTFVGGPVAQNTLHFIHRRPDLIEKSARLTQDIYWGGDFQRVIQLFNQGLITAQDIRFFVGYAGWDAGQLFREVKKESWVIGGASASVLFDTPPADLWRTVLRNMGGKYQIMANFPTDPSLN